MKLIQPTEFRTLYKYTSQRWLDSLLRKGRFRIGSLYEYRSYEHAEIGDTDEGKKQFAFWGTGTIKGLTVAELNQQFPKLHIGNTSNKVLIPSSEKDEQIPVGIEIHSPDSYLFCMTEVFDKEVMRRFGYDACLEITDPSRFFVQLSKAMRPFANFGSMERCQYGTRYGLYEHHTELRPQILKPEALQHQREVRILWDPKISQSQQPLGTPNLFPIFVCRPKAAMFLRRVA
ncbi:MAG: hypothetical protein WBK19_14930 [Azonexus sp.]